MEITFIKVIIGGAVAAFSGLIVLLAIIGSARVKRDQSLENDL